MLESNIVEKNEDIQELHTDISPIDQSFVSWDLGAVVLYGDESKVAVTTKDISYDFPDIGLAVENSKRFTINKIKQKAIFDCEVIEGPFGKVIVGSLPSTIELGNGRSIAKVFNELNLTETPTNELFASQKYLRRHQIYAPPLKYGLWREVIGHIGRASFKISVKPIGNTDILGQVRFFDEENKRIIEDFGKSVRIRTGNSVAAVEVRLKGNPLGSSCYVDVE